MTTYYVGPTAAGAADGSSWNDRYGSLNDAEDTPVVAGDTVYVGPGVYRETLTVDVSGGAGTEIVYIGDVTGEHTDGIGGVVRITGSDNDQSATRNNCIIASSKNYRIFRGFMLDTTVSHVVDWTGANSIFEDCMVMMDSPSAGFVFRDTGTDNTVRRCILLGGTSNGGIVFTHGSTVSNTDHVVENCLFNVGLRGVDINRIGGISIRNCDFLGREGPGIQVRTALAAGQTTWVYNCIFWGNSLALQATVLGEITEDYNTLYGNGTDRTNVAVGGSSQTYPPLFEPPILQAGASQTSGYKFPWWYGELSEWSQVRAITGTGTASEDLWALTRPPTASKLSWGACQFVDMERDASTVYDGVASLKLADAGRHQVFVPINAVSTTVTVRVYREANYAGNAPQMIVKQPGQADDTTMDVGAASAWNELTTTLTPSGETDFIVVELVSRNTAAAGNYATYFDNLVVS